MKTNEELEKEIEELKNKVAEIERRLLLGQSPYFYPMSYPYPAPYYPQPSIPQTYPPWVFTCKNAVNTQ